MAQMKYQDIAASKFIYTGSEGGINKNIMKSL